jgi:predicted small secreted protein
VRHCGVIPAVYEYQLEAASAAEPSLATLTILLRYLSGGLAQIVLLLLQKRYPRRLETEMDRIIFAIFMLILLGTTAACNTVHGLGRDVARR